MSRDKNLTLKMKILANAKQAMAEIKLFDSSLRRWTSGDGLFGQIGSGAKMGFGLVGKTAGIALAPLKVFAGIAGIAGIAAGALGGYALNAAGSMESLQMRMEAVLPSIQAAKKAMAESEQYFGKSPFYIDDIVEARIKLESIGVRGARAVKSLGNASAITRRSLAEMAQVIASMESEPLKAMGIRMKQEGEKATFTFYDKMGKMRTIAAEGALEIRKSILRIFDIKFGSAVDRLLGTFGAKFDMLKGNLFRGAAKFGEGLLPGSGDFLSDINDRLTKLLEGGQLEEWGKRAGDWLSSAVAQVTAAMSTLGDMWSQLSTQGPAAISEALMAGLDAVMKSAGLIFVESITGSANMLVAVAKMMASAFMEDIVQLPLPFMEPTRRGLALQGIEQASADQLKEIFPKYAKMFDKKNKPFALNYIKGMLSREVVDGEMSVEQEAALVGLRGGPEFASAAAAFRTGMTDMLVQMKNDVAASFSEAGAKLKDRTGFDFGATMEMNLAEEKGDTSRRWMALEPVYRTSNTGAVARDESGRKQIEKWIPIAWEDGSANAHQEGLQTRGGGAGGFQSKSGRLSGVGSVSAPQERLIISIQNVNVRADNIQKLVQDAIRRVAPNQFAPAGT